MVFFFLPLTKKCIFILDLVNSNYKIHYSCLMSLKDICGENNILQTKRNVLLFWMIYFFLFCLRHNFKFLLDETMLQILFLWKYITIFSKILEISLNSAHHHFECGVSLVVNLFWHYPQLYYQSHSTKQVPKMLFIMHINAFYNATAIYTCSANF